ncbi:MAG: NUDIX hydrolase [Halofilum sp. (in: g-proteobacteria)]
MNDATLTVRQRPIVATIAVVTAGDAVLLVRRANPPDAGCWGFPGGKIEHGETVWEAAVRELEEETGVHAEALNTFTAVDAIDRDAAGALRHHHVLIAVLCRYQSGTPTARSDALEARWFTLSEFDEAAVTTSFRVAEVAREALAEYRRRLAMT